MSGRSFQSYANTHNISVTVGIYTLEDPVRYEPIMEFVSNVVVVEERSGLSSGCDSHLGLIRRVGMAGMPASYFRLNYLDSEG